MGKPKYLLPFHGMPQWKYLKKLGERLGLEVFFSANEKQSLASENCIYDLLPEKGPLGGIYSAQKHLPGQAFLVLPCDMPNIGAKVLQHLIRNRDKSRQGSFYLNETREEVAPFPGIWEPSSQLLIEKEIEAKSYSLIRMIRAMNFHLIRDMKSETFLNINTPEAYLDFIQKKKD